VALGVSQSNIHTTFVPDGPFELPVVAKLLAASKRVDVIINALCIIHNEKKECDYVLNSVANGLVQVACSLLVYSY
jgi:6,7-dimethyl-8-ribityllumazine synthase